MSELTRPTVHLNGTSKEALVRGYLDSARDLRRAFQTLTDNSPHKRDYYPQGDAAWSKAVSEHSSRLGRLLDVLAEINALADAVEFDQPATIPDPPVPPMKEGA